MGLLKELSILISSLPTLAVIFGGIWKALTGLVRGFHRWLDLKENRVLARQQVAVEKARAEGFTEGQSYCMAWVFAFVLLFIYLSMVKPASAQA
jgi:hypothetical protein